MPQCPDARQWPADLKWIVDRLEPAPFQEMTETLMNAGNVRRRPKRTPLEYLKAEVELNNTDWNAVQGLEGGLVEIPDPVRGGQTCCKLYINVKSTTTKNGSPLSRIAELNFVRQPSA